MIGYQCSPSSQAQQLANSMRAPTTNNTTTTPNNASYQHDGHLNPTPGSPVQANNTGGSDNTDEREQSSLGSATNQHATVLSSLNSHINLINRTTSHISHQNRSPKSLHQQQQVASSTSSRGDGANTTNTTTTTTTGGNSTTASSVSPNQLMHSSSSSSTQSASSPGYHSAASSPTSSVASPVSSSSSSSLAGGSSGISTASCSISSSSSSSMSSHHSLHSSSSASVSPSSSRSPISPNLLDYYPEINHDGLGLSWFHDANNRSKLSAALMTNKMVVSGDISLAEMSRYPVPIMAKPPLGVSDITLENWLQEVVHSQKGIKLTFTSTRTVEPAFRVLARHAEHLKGPLILNADILTKPQINGAQNGAINNNNNRSNKQQQLQLQQQCQQQQQPVDAWTFLMLCRTRFPKSIISIGWCSLNSQHLSNWATASNNANHSHDSIMSSGIAECSSSSLHSSADSMFELDIMDTHPPPALGQLTGASHSHLGHLQHLSHHQHRLHQHLHPYPLVQQQQQQQQQQQHHRHSHLINHHQLSHHLSQHNSNHHHLMSHHHHHHSGLGHHILSSTGSLNSSSGNSSGSPSPSPTSPISHLMSPPHQTVPTNLSMGNKSSATSSVDSTEQLFLAAAAAAAAASASTAVGDHHHHQNGGTNTSGPKSSTGTAAAAAAMAAAVVAATNFHNHHHQQQLPLNLNINEADQQLSTSSAVSLSNLAQKIQSYQTLNQHHHNLTTTQAPTNHESSSSSLSSKLLFQNNSANSSAHINKKTALGANSNTPSPQSTSPKQQQQQSVAQQPNNLLLKTAAAQQQQQQVGGATGCNGSSNQLVGYTREMIDKMASLVKEYNLTQPVTFPVEARMLRNSLGELQRLLYQVGSNSTLTVVAQQEDLISVDDLLTIRKAFATNQVLFDLPDDLAASFKQELDLLL